jgi:DNA/RNA non-specific endonuclease
MASEGQLRQAPAPSRRVAAQREPPARSVGAARAGLGPADLQLRLGNRGAQTFLSQLAGASFTRAAGTVATAGTRANGNAFPLVDRGRSAPTAIQPTAPQAAPVAPQAAQLASPLAKPPRDAGRMSPGQQSEAPAQARSEAPAAQATPATPPTPTSPAAAGVAPAGPEAAAAAVAAGEAPAASAPAAATTAPETAAAPAAPAAPPGAAATAPAEAEAAPEPEPAPVVTPREAIAPAAAAIAARAQTARMHAPAASVAKAAQAAAINPATEQRRGAAVSTVAAISEAKPGAVSRSDFKTKLAEALHKKVPAPTSPENAQEIMRDGAHNASGALRGELNAQRAQAAGPMAAAASRAAEVNPANVPAPAAAPLSPEQAGAPPEPVSADSVVPPALPAQQLDYSSDRAETDRMMAQNNVTSAQLEDANEPTFGAAVEARQGAEAREAQMPGEFRAAEAGVREQARVTADRAVVQGLGAFHGGRTASLAGVAAQQMATRDVDAAKRTEITQQLDRIKSATQAGVREILDRMEKNAGEMFQQGLERAERAYEDVFEEEKGGFLNRVAHLFGGWEEVVNRAFEAARRAYDAEVSTTIDQVANYVEGELAQAKQRVEQGRAEADRFVAGLDANLAQFGREAAAQIGADFDAMAGEIDHRRDQLVDALAKQYGESHQRISDLEQKLRTENRSLWQRIKDATVGVIQTIIEFKNMLLGVLARAAEVVEQIILHPISFLGNLITGVKAGLDQFVANIVKHLKEGLMGWLFGALEGAGLQLPENFDLKGLLSIVLQVLGLTKENIRARAVRLVGEETVSHLEKVGEIFKILVKEGPVGLWNMLLEKLGNFTDMLLEQFRNWVIEKIIKAGVLWLVSLLNPAAAFIKACKAIYNIVMFFIERGKQILDLVNAVLDSLSAIVAGNTQAMADKVEQALARTIPVAIGFLASLLDLDDVSEKIRQIIASLQKPVNSAIDWVIGKGIQLARSAGQLLKGRKGKEKETEHPDPEKQLKIEAGKAAIHAEEAKHLHNGKIDKQQAEQVAAVVKAQHPVFQTLVIIDGGATWNYEFTASPGEEETGALKEKFSQEDLEKTKLEPPTTLPAGYNKAAPGGYVRAGKAWGIVKLKDGDRDALPAVGTLPGGKIKAYQPGDHRGHLIGDRFGGLSVALNLVPMHKDLNLSTFKKYENDVAKQIKDTIAERGCALAEMLVEPEYPNNDENDAASYRPISVTASFGLVTFKLGSSPPEVETRSMKAWPPFKNESVPREKPVYLNSANLDHIANLTGMNVDLAAKIIAKRQVKELTRWAQVEEAVGADTVEKMTGNAYKPVLLKEP